MWKVETLSLLFVPPAKGGGMEIFMNIVGLITEYNPFHNGHLYHIQEAKRVTGADAAVVIMSGNFVQRGTPAIMPKHLRAKAALLSGADLVLELPVCFATGSAEFFAMGAVALLDSLGCIDSICFGSECGDSETLGKIARILAEENVENNGFVLFLLIVSLHHCQLIKVRQ